MLYKSEHYKEMQKVQYELEKRRLFHGVDNKRSALVAAILHWLLPFCIALCLVDLFGLVVEDALALDFDVDGV